MITQKEIAEILGISRTTVARALKENSSIKKETKEKILKLMKEKNYEKNYFGSSLAGKEKVVYAFIVESKNKFYTNEIKRGMEDIQKKYRKYNLSIKIKTHNIKNPDMQVEAIKNIITNKRVDGILVVPLDKEKIYALLSELKDKIPIISLTMQLNDSISHIGIDYHKQGRMVANILAHCMRENENLIILDNGDDKLSTKDYLDGFYTRIQEEKINILGPYSCNGVEDSVKMLKKILAQKNIVGIFSNRYAQNIVKLLPKELMKGKKIVLNGMSEKIKELLKEKKIVASVMEEVYEEAYLAGKLIFNNLYKNQKIERNWKKVDFKIVYLENLDKI